MRYASKSSCRKITFAKILMIIVIFLTLFSYIGYRKKFIEPASKVIVAGKMDYYENWRSYCIVDFNWLTGTVDLVEMDTLPVYENIKTIDADLVKKIGSCWEPKNDRSDP